MMSEITLKKNSFVLQNTNITEKDVQFYLTRTHIKFHYPVKEMFANQINQTYYKRETST